MSTEPTPTTPALLTVRDLAGRLSCSTRHVHRLLDRGAVPGVVRLGKLLRFEPAAVAAWIAGGCRPDTTRPGTSGRK